MLDVTSGVKLLTEESSFTSGVDGRTVPGICKYTKKNIFDNQTIFWRVNQQKNFCVLLHWNSTFLPSSRGLHTIIKPSRLTCWTFFRRGAPCVLLGRTLLLWWAALWFSGADCMWLGPNSKSESMQNQSKSLLHKNKIAYTEEKLTWIGGFLFVQRHFRWMPWLLTKRILQQHAFEMTMRFFLSLCLYLVHVVGTAHAE